MTDETPTPQTAPACPRANARGGGVFSIAATALALLEASLVPAANLVPSPTQPKLQDTITMTAPKPQTPRAAQSDPALLGRTDSVPIRILVKLDYDPVSSYGGDIPGLAATSPAKSGKRLSQNKPAVDAYTAYVVAYETKVLDRIKQRIPTAKVGERYRTAYGGVGMTLPANRIGELLAIEGVVAVQQDSLEHTNAVR